MKEAKRQAKKQAENDYEKKREELEEKIKAAEKAYKDAEEQEESAVLSAKRAVEDAEGEPDSDYDMQMLQMEIYQNQRDLNELYMKKSMGEEGLEEQIRALEDNLRVLWLRQQEMESTKKKQEEERERTLLRAQEDYIRTVKKYAKLVDEAKQKLDEANLALDEFLESDGEEFLEDEFVKAAEEALKAANKALEAARRQAENEKQQAKRNLEDASVASTAGSQPEIDRIQIMERQRQLAILQQAEENRGKITAQMEGTVTSVQLEAGQRTGGSAVFLITGTSGGMNFATEISREDAVYVTVGDTVTLRTANEEYEELSVVSVEEGEQKETVKVNVFVPKDLISPGEYAQMELTKTSREYGTIVPISAIHTENEKNFVYVMALEETVLGEQYTAKCVDVTIAQKNEACAALTDTELQADSQIIVSSDRMLSEGERVRFKEEAVE